MTKQATVDALLDVYHDRGKRLRAVDQACREALQRSNFAGTHQFAQRLLTIVNTPRKES